MGMGSVEYDNILYCDLLLKVEGFAKRMDHEENMVRTAAFSSYIAPHLNVKKMAKTLEAFWPMKKGTDTKKVSDARREAIKLELQRRKLENNGSKA